MIVFVKTCEKLRLRILTLKICSVFVVLKVESDHPEYRSRFKSTQQSVDIEFSSLQVKLHQEALLNIIDLSTKMLPPR